MKCRTFHVARISTWFPVIFDWILVNLSSFQNEYNDYICLVTFSFGSRSGVRPIKGMAPQTSTAHPQPSYYLVTLTRGWSGRVNDDLPRKSSWKWASEILFFVQNVSGWLCGHDGEGQNRSHKTIQHSTYLWRCTSLHACSSSLDNRNASICVFFFCGKNCINGNCFVFFSILAWRRWYRNFKSEGSQESGVGDLYLVCKWSKMISIQKTASIFWIRTGWVLNLVDGGMLMLRWHRAKWSWLEMEWAEGV